MIITDTLNGRTVEDVRRNTDGSVTLYCDSGHPLTVHVVDGVIEAKPPDIATSTVDAPVQIASSRMNLLTAFQGYTVNYAYHDDTGNLVFVCHPLRHDRKRYEKSLGHREIRVVHKDGLISELPPVSAKIALPSQGLVGTQGR